MHCVTRPKRFDFKHALWIGSKVSIALILPKRGNIWIRHPSSNRQPQSQPDNFSSKSKTIVRCRSDTELEPLATIYWKPSSSSIHLDFRHLHEEIDITLFTVQQLAGKAAVFCWTAIWDNSCFLINCRSDTSALVLSMRLQSSPWAGIYAVQWCTFTRYKRQCGPGPHQGVEKDGFSTDDDRHRLRKENRTAK